MPDADLQDPPVTDPSAKAEKTTEVLSFKPLGRPLELESLEDEFQLMRDALKKPLTTTVARGVCEKSGTHLLKLVSSRVDGKQAVLNVQPGDGSPRQSILPSVGAGEIPYAKLLFRPLEIAGHPTRSVIDDVLNPDAVSPRVLEAFASVFGNDVRVTIEEVLLDEPRDILKLAVGEFPIVFIPRPGGGDLQVTPVAPARIYMGMKAILAPFFEKQLEDGPKIPRGTFTKQAISSKPQNISGAIGGPRQRLMAKMPPGMNRFPAELHRFLQGGRFPRFHGNDIDTWVLRYADMLEREDTYSDRNTRAACDRTADRLIRDAGEFVEETLEEARMAAPDVDGKDPAITEPPSIGKVLLRRAWGHDETSRKARKALSSPHFKTRVRKYTDRKRS